MSLCSIFCAKQISTAALMDAPLVAHRRFAHSFNLSQQPQASVEMQLFQGTLHVPQRGVDFPARLIPMPVGQDHVACN